MPRRTLATCLVLIFASTALATPLDDAIALYKEKKTLEARAALETLTAAEPGNAEACYYLGLTLLRTHDPKLLESAVAWFKKAVDLQPENVAYLFEYGGNCLNLSDKTRSLSTANRGRDALEKLLTLAPAHLEAHVALYQFYEQAPWPLGNSAKAIAHLEEIRLREPDRALSLLVATKTKSKNYAEAFKLCDEALVKNSDNAISLLLYGQTAIASSQNLDLALTRLNQCLTLPPPPRTAGPAYIHWQIGLLQEKRGDIPAARAAYEAALSINPDFPKASAALEKLR